MPDEFKITAGFKKGSNWIFELSRKIFLTRDGDLVDIVDVVMESVYPEVWLFGGWVRNGSGGLCGSKKWWHSNGENVVRVRVDSSEPGTKSFHYRSRPGSASDNIISDVECVFVNGKSTPIQFSYGSLYATVGGAVVRPVHEYWADDSLFGVMCQIEGMPHGTDRNFAIEGPPGANGRTIGQPAWSLSYAGSKLVPNAKRPDLVVVKRVNSDATVGGAATSQFKMQSRMVYTCKVPMPNGRARTVEIKYWMSSLSVTGWVGRVDVAEKETASVVFSPEGVPIKFTDSNARALHESEIADFTINTSAKPYPVDDAAKPAEKQLSFESVTRLEMIVGAKYQMRNGQKVKISVGYPDSTYYGWAKGAKTALKFDKHGTCVASGTSVRDLSQGPKVQFDIITSWKDRASTAPSRSGRKYHKVYTPPVYRTKTKETNPSVSEIVDEAQFELPRI